MIDFNQMQFFVEIARSLSITMAAKKLGVPKSTVSRSLMRLEKRLGVRLLHRSTRQLVLTEIGEEYLNHCVRVVDEAERADLAIESMRQGTRGLLRVGSPVTFAHIFIAPGLAGFLNSHPDLRVQLILRGGPLNPLTDGLDIGIQVGQVAESSLIAKCLGEAQVGVFASAEYAEKYGLPVTPEDLYRHVCLTSGETGRTTVWTLCRQQESGTSAKRPRGSWRSIHSEASSPRWSRTRVAARIFGYGGCINRPSSARAA